MSSAENPLPRVCHPAETVSLGLLSGGLFSLSLLASGWPAFVLLLLFGVAGNSFYEQLRVTKGQALYELVNLLSSLFSKYAVAMPQPKAQQWVAQLVGENVGYWTQSMANEVDPTTPDFWTKKRIEASKILCGIRGSGKSVLSEYIVSMLIDGTDLLISDRHYDNEESGWLLTMDKQLFQDKILIPTAFDTYKALCRYRRELQKRIAAGNKSAQPIHILIDEWGGCWREWDEQQQTDVISILEFINEEGRKYHVNYTLIVHQLTEKRTGLPEAVTTAVDLYLLGDAISATTYTFPASLSVDRKRLIGERQQVIAGLTVPQRAVVYRNSLEGQARVIVTPDLNEPPKIEIQDVSDSLEQVWETDISARAMCEKLGITNRRKDNPRYIEVIDFLKAKEEQINETA